MEPEDIELDDEPLRVRRRERTGMVASVRFDFGETERLLAAAERVGQNVVELTKQAVLNRL